jgi:hypothetical protein
MGASERAEILMGGECHRRLTRAAACPAVRRVGAARGRRHDEERVPSVAREVDHHAPLQLAVEPAVVPAGPGDRVGAVPSGHRPDPFSQRPRSTPANDSAPSDRR